MVRRPERPPVGQGAIGQLPGDGEDHRDFEQLARRERRQDRGQAARQHRLAGPRRPVHQKVVPAGRRDLEHAPRAFLALDVGEIGQGPGLTRHRWLGPGHHLRALEVIGELDQRAWRQDVDIGRRPGRFRARSRRADQPLPFRVGRDRRGQDARDRRDRAVEREFAEHRIAREGIGGNRSDRRHHGKRDRQIVMAAFLGHISRR